MKLSGWQVLQSWRYLIYANGRVFDYCIYLSAETEHNFLRVYQGPGSSYINFQLMTSSVINGTHLRTLLLYQYVTVLSTYASVLTIDETYRDVSDLVSVVTSR